MLRANALCDERKPPDNGGQQKYGGAFQFFHFASQNSMSVSEQIFSMIRHCLRLSTESASTASSPTDIVFKRRFMIYPYRRIPACVSLFAPRSFFARASPAKR